MGAQPGYAQQQAKQISTNKARRQFHWCTTNTKPKQRHDLMDHEHFSGLSGTFGLKVGLGHVARKHFLHSLQSAGT